MISVTVARSLALPEFQSIEGFRLSDSSMSPWRCAGLMVYASTAIPAEVGNFVVVEFAGRPDAFLVGRLSAMADDEIVVEKFTPAKTLRVDRRQVSRLLRVLSPHHLLLI